MSGSGRVHLAIVLGGGPRLTTNTARGDGGGCAEGEGEGEGEGEDDGHREGHGQGSRPTKHKTSPQRRPPGDRDRGGACKQGFASSNGATSSVAASQSVGEGEERAGGCLRRRTHPGRDRLSPWSVRPRQTYV